MKKIARILSLVVVLALIAVSAVSCGNKSEEAVSSTSEAGVSSSAAPLAEINLATLKGPTGIGMVGLLDAADNGTAANKYNYVIASSPDEVTSKLVSGAYDIAAVPTNAAAALYNATEGKVQILALNTLGVLYIVENGNTVNSVADLKGKTIYVSGQGATPEYVLDYILSKNGIDPDKDVTIEFKTDHAEVATIAATQENAVCLLPEPNVTATALKNSNLRVALNITDEWSKAAPENSVLSMGCVVVRKEFAEQNKAAVDAFLDEYKASIEKVNSDIDLAAALCAKYEIVGSEAAAKAAIPRCNIVYIDGSEMKAQIANFYDVLYNANVKSVGGKLPDDNFYYQK